MNEHCPLDMQEYAEKGGKEGNGTQTFTGGVSNNELKELFWA